MNHAVKQLREAYDAAVSSRHRAEDHEKACAEALRGWCDHPVEQIVEVDYIQDPDGRYHTPPFRVCCVCGYAEEGWGAGYWKLAPRVYSVRNVSRDEGNRLLIGSILRQDQMRAAGRYGK